MAVFLPWDRHASGARGNHLDLANRTAIAYPKRSVSLRKVIFTLALALLWVTASNGCALAAAVPGFPPPCACDTPSEPCGQGCHTCLTLESGANLAALTPVAVPARMPCEDEQLWQWLRAMVLAALETGTLIRPAPVWDPPAPAALMLAVALPVRGPTLFA